jgi:Holliday junction resolvasome RuvABC endonuclease subunit
MRSAGIDVAGAGIAAIGFAVDGRPTRHSIWKPDNIKDSPPIRLLSYERWLNFQLALFKPDIVAVEELAVFMNKKVIRVLSHHEGVALLCAKKHASIVVNPSVGTARSITLSSGGLKKEDAFEEMKKLYPDIKFPAKNQGGMDVADALTHAIAAPTVAERKK